MNDTPLVFKTDAEKVAALEKIQNKPGGATPADIEEIDRITEAEINEEYIVPPEDSVQPTETEDGTKTDMGRNWQITEDLIKKHDETYYDPDSKRERSYITHKTAEDFLESFKEAQKHIRYIKDDVMPKKISAAAEKAKAEAKVEYDTKLSVLQRELEEAKKVTVKPPAQQPLVSDDDEIAGILETLEGISDEDAIEHVGDVKKALIVAMKKLSMSNTDKNELIRQVEQRATEKFDQYKRDRDAEYAEKKRLEDAEKQALLQQQKILEVYEEVNQFVASKDCPKELKLDGQKHQDALREALGFHSELAELYTGKTKESYDSKTWRELEEKASVEYLNKTPQLLQKINEAGIKEPKNYRKWVLLDNIDAIRTGYFRNPQTNNWEKRYDSKTGKEIQFPDFKSAFNYYLDESGLRKVMSIESGRKDTANLIDAMNRRDSGVVQLDESALSGSGSGQVMTEEEANNYLNTVDKQRAIIQKMEGNPEAYNKINAALIRLGETPLDM